MPIPCLAGIRPVACSGLTDPVSSNCHVILAIERLAIEPEALLGRTTIAEQFDANFFKTNFWYLWSTTFAFQPWHSAVEFQRYLVRFAHMVPGFSRLEGIMRTPLNHYDSMVRPLQKWLADKGKVFQMNTAQTAVYTLLDLNRDIPAVYKGKFDPRVLYKALHGVAA